MKKAWILGVIACITFSMNALAQESSSAYAREAAQEIKNAYTYARFTSFTTSKSKVENYRSTAINSAKKAILLSKKAIQLEPDNQQLVFEMENCRLQAKKAIRLLQKVPSNNYADYHQYANLAAASAGNGIISAYNGMLSAGNTITNETAIKETEVDAVVAKLDKLPAKNQPTSAEPDKPINSTKIQKVDTSKKETGYTPTEKDLELAKQAKEKQSIISEEEPTAAKEKEKEETSPAMTFIIGGSTLLSLASLAVYGHFAAAKSTAIAVSSPEILFNQPGTPLNSFIGKYATIGAVGTAIQMSIHPFNILALPKRKYESVVNLNKINDMLDINGFFASVNSKLEVGGYHIACVETSEQRKVRLLRKFPLVMAQVYYVADFVFKRIFPKLPITRQIYFFVTAGRNRVITTPEAMGRMAAAGFKIEETKEVDNHLFIVGKKESEPDKKPKSSEGLFFRMKRIGKKGKEITVYKFRTMHPYAEYLQDYVYDKNNLQEGGKFKNDFRISAWGRIMRKLWIDELPMLINLLKGEIKLVGVRPLSPHFLSLYSEELKEKRKQVSPGLIPPFYADLPKTLEEIMDSEMRYLDAYSAAPFKTNFKYFTKAVSNIIFKRARSN